MWTPLNVKRVWIFTFELEDLARVGGLGSAVRRHVEILEREGFDITIFMPSHGRHLSNDIRERYRLRFEENFRCCGSRRGIDGRDYGYCLGAYTGRISSAKLVLFIGLDPWTGSIIDRWEIYDNSPEKVSLSIRALRCWLNYSRERPDIIIGNDWHGGLIASAARIYLEEENLSIPYIYFIHLLSSQAFPYHYISSEWSGLPDRPIPLWRFWRHEKIHIRDLWDSHRGSVELFNIDVADAIGSVSYGYMNEILSRTDYRYSPKACVIYNTTDWNSRDVERYLDTLYGGHDRCALRWRFYRDMISRAGPCIGHIEPDGFLIVSGGRLTWQKGFDILLKSLEYLDPRFKILILGVRVGDTNYENYLKSIADRFFGRALITCNNIEKIVYETFNYLANVVVVPSRYEPFGLTSVEAQAVGTPVVISRIPGLSETIRDLRLNPSGTGLASEPEDPRDLAIAIKTLAIITQSLDCGSRDAINEIPEVSVRDLVRANPSIIEKIRENCIDNVNKNFRVEVVENMFRECIEKARLYAYYRSFSY
ncbi:MAG: glycogen/starch synthase [Sulfolobales archaeon]